MANNNTKTVKKWNNFSFAQKLFIFRNSDIVRPPRNANYILLLTLVAVLNIIGVVMVLSASSVTAISDYGSPWFFFQRQLIWLALGACAFIIMSRIPYTVWQKYTTPIMIISFILLFIVLIPGIGIEVAGSRRWLGIGAWRFQPSELAKFALVIFVADILTRRATKMGSFKEVMGPIILTSMLMMFLVVIAPDFDSAAVLSFIVASIVIMSGVPLRFIGKVAAPFAALAAIVVLIEPYRRERILTYMNPFEDASNSGYQITQSLIALGSGQSAGVGLGAGKAKWLFLPNAHTDFIFAIVGEELGFVGTMMVLSLFIAFILLGIKIILSCKDRFSALMATGIVAWIGGQALVNLMAVIGLIPVSGITLPFLSFGGSSLLISMAAAGVLANIARYSRA